MVEKTIKAFKSILFYIANKKPKNLQEAEHMLAVIEVISRETLNDIEEASLPTSS